MIQNQTRHEKSIDFSMKDERNTRKYNLRTKACSNYQINESNLYQEITPHRLNVKPFKNILNIDVMQETDSRSKSKDAQEAETYSSCKKITQVKKSSDPKADSNDVGLKSSSRYFEEGERLINIRKPARGQIKYRLNGSVTRIFLPVGKEHFPIRGTKASMVRRKKILQMYPRVHDHHE